MYRNSFHFQKDFAFYSLLKPFILPQLYIFFQLGITSYNSQPIGLRMIPMSLYFPGPVCQQVAQGLQWLMWQSLVLVMLLKGTSFCNSGWTQPKHWWLPNRKCTPYWNWDKMYLWPKMHSLRIKDFLMHRIFRCCDVMQNVQWWYSSFSPFILHSLQFHIKHLETTTMHSRQNLLTQNDAVILQCGKKVGQINSINIFVSKI